MAVRVDRRKFLAGAAGAAAEVAGVRTGATIASMDSAPMLYPGTGSRRAMRQP